jgi:hypothetical protein
VGGVGWQGEELRSRCAAVNGDKNTAKPVT